MLPVFLSKTLRELLEYRESSDYDLELKDVELVAQKTFQQAEAFLNEVIKWQGITQSP
jgi:hypothetical protein